MYSEEVHLTKVKILQAALSNMKTNARGLKGRELVEFRHDLYKHLREGYFIPEDTCPTGELYKRMHDGSQLERVE